MLPYASNHTLLARAANGEEEVLAIYKPVRGERPLWDFARGTLGRRELCAFLVSEAAGFGIVPPTVLRKDAPQGEGSLQLFMEHDPQRHYFALAKQRLEDFAEFAAFDVVINNADRKAGHVLEDRSRRLWAVDHGVTFHVEPKLRTVIWDFAEKPLPERVRARLRGLREELVRGVASDLADLLSPEEAEAVLRRTDDLLSAGVFPAPSEHYPLPWPLV